MLWDLGNNCCKEEKAFLAENEELGDGCLGRIHMQDVQPDISCVKPQVCRMSEGHSADQFELILDALKADGYDGVISFDSVFPFKKWKL